VKPGIVPRETRSAEAGDHPEAEVTARYLKTRLTSERVYDGAQPTMVRTSGRAGPWWSVSRRGYRVAWETVNGGFGAEVIRKHAPWSGPQYEPPSTGMLFCNRPIDATNGDSGLAPTVLDCWVPVPPHLDGKPFMDGRPRRHIAQANPHPGRSEAPQSA